jgi:hypothetical protein
MKQPQSYKMAMMMMMMMMKMMMIYLAPVLRTAPAELAFEGLPDTQTGTPPDIMESF